ncbi:Ubiquitin receptor RAD23b [Histomonas meleagridis]|uniref:Ubiquitin receptor RAD23b n=1 Tax=Histomonas meleagridis TaxID=135588 RepID=UPI00355A0361|nr:Ubiquitin receptor RAD23b [Histomonas meleagridis]KAH0804651.1 Ubiquitin receptor RAD23b [Histomonas meleagridis]
MLIHIVDFQNIDTEVEIEEGMTVMQLLEYIQNTFSIDTSHSVLIQNGKELEFNEKLTHEMFEEENSLVVYHCKVFPEKSFPKVNRAFNFKASKYQEYFSNPKYGGIDGSSVYDFNSRNHQHFNFTYGNRLGGTQFGTNGPMFTNPPFGNPPFANGPPFGNNLFGNGPQFGGGGGGMPFGYARRTNFMPYHPYQFNFNHNNDEDEYDADEPQIPHINYNDNEQEDIEHLVGLGFDRLLAIQIYEACDRNVGAAEDILRRMAE